MEESFEIVQDESDDDDEYFMDEVFNEDPEDFIRNVGQEKDGLLLGLISNGLTKGATRAQVLAEFANYGIDLSHVDQNSEMFDQYDTEDNPLKHYVTLYRNAEVRKKLESAFKPGTKAYNKIYNYGVGEHTFLHDRRANEFQARFFKKSQLGKAFITNGFSYDNIHKSLMDAYVHDKAPIKKPVPVPQEEEKSEPEMPEAEPRVKQPSTPRKILNAFGNMLGFTKKKVTRADQRLLELQDFEKQSAKQLETKLDVYTEKLKKQFEKREFDEESKRLFKNAFDENVILHNVLLFTFDLLRTVQDQGEKYERLQQLTKLKALETTGDVKSDYKALLQCWQIADDIITAAPKKKIRTIKKTRTITRSARTHFYKTMEKYNYKIQYDSKLSAMIKFSKDWGNRLHEQIPIIDYMYKRLDDKSTVQKRWEKIKKIGSVRSAHKLYDQQVADASLLGAEIATLYFTDVDRLEEGPVPDPDVANQEIERQLKKLKSYVAGDPNFRELQGFMQRQFGQIYNSPKYLYALTKLIKDKTSDPGDIKRNQGVQYYRKLLMKYDWNVAFGGQPAPPKQPAPAQQPPAQSADMPKSDRKYQTYTVAETGAANVVSKRDILRVNESFGPKPKKQNNAKELWKVYENKKYCIADMVDVVKFKQDIYNQIKTQKEMDAFAQQYFLPILQKFKVDKAIGGLFQMYKGKNYYRFGSSKGYDNKEIVFGNMDVDKMQRVTSVKKIVKLTGKGSLYNLFFTAIKKIIESGGPKQPHEFDLPPAIPDSNISTEMSEDRQTPPPSPQILPPIPLARDEHVKYHEAVKKIAPVKPQKKPEPKAEEKKEPEDEKVQPQRRSRRSAPQLIRKSYGKKQALLQKLLYGLKSDKLIEKDPSKIDFVKWQLYRILVQNAKPAWNMYGQSGVSMRAIRKEWLKNTDDPFRNFKPETKKIFENMLIKSDENQQMADIILNKKVPPLTNQWLYGESIGDTEYNLYKQLWFPRQTQQRVKFKEEPDIPAVQRNRVASQNPRVGMKRKMRQSAYEVHRQTENKTKEAMSELLITALNIRTKNDMLYCIEALKNIYGLRTKKGSPDFDINVDPSKWNWKNKNYGIGLTKIWHGVVGAIVSHPEWYPKAAQDLMFVPDQSAAMKITPPTTPQLQPQVSPPSSLNVTPARMKMPALRMPTGSPEKSKEDPGYLAQKQKRESATFMTPIGTPSQTPRGSPRIAPVRKVKRRTPQGVPILSTPKQTRKKLIGPQSQLRNFTPQRVSKIDPVNRIKYADNMSVSSSLASSLRTTPIRSANSSTVSSPADANLHELFYGLIHDGEAEMLQSFTIASPARSVAMSRLGAVSAYTGHASMIAHAAKPIPGHTIVSLKNIRERMGDKRELFTDESMIGFNKKIWEKKLYDKFPINFEPGVHKDLGRWIQTKYSKHHRRVVCVIRQKATDVQMDKLIWFLEGTCPTFGHVKCQIRRKKGNEDIYDLQNWMDLRQFIKNQLTGVGRIMIIVSW